MATDQDRGIADEVADQLLAGGAPATVFESGGLIDELKKRLAARMLNAEMDHHPGSAAPEEAGNHRNGSGQKTVLTDTGKLELSIPCEMTTRALAGRRGELYGAALSPDLARAATDAVLEEVGAWRGRGLEATWAIVCFDAIRVKIRNDGLVGNRAVYLAIGVRGSGHQESWALGSSGPRARNSGCG